MRISSTPTAVIKEIKKITEDLIGKGWVVNQNFPSARQNGRQIEITWAGQSSLGPLLGGIPYAEAYKALIKVKNYNFELFDGALVQMMYQFNGNDLLGHRLCYIPKAELDVDNEDISGESSALAMVELPVPLRFDYAPHSFVNMAHPRSHLHISQYADCRLPLCSPITPNMFIGFILRNFYAKKFQEDFNTKNFVIEDVFRSRTISVEEERFMHINLHQGGAMRTP